MAISTAGFLENLHLLSWAEGKEKLGLLARNLLGS